MMGLFFFCCEFKSRSLLAPFYCDDNLVHFDLSEHRTCQTLEYPLTAGTRTQDVACELCSSINRKGHSINCGTCLPNYYHTTTGASVGVVDVCLGWMDTLTESQPCVCQRAQGGNQVLLNVVVVVDDDDDGFVGDGGFVVL